jgi:hypothetical protein
MKRLFLIAFVLLLMGGCASQKNAPVPSAVGDAEFDSSTSGRAFLTKPREVSVEGDHSEFGRSSVDELWLNAIRGGYSQAHYRYFLFRVPSLLGRGRVDVVFFNDDGKGFFVPVEIAPADPGGAAFTLYREAGGGESYTAKSTLRGLIRANAGDPTITISLDCVNKLSMLFIPAGQQQWRSRMTFGEAALPNTTLQAAKEIDGRIRR